MGKKRERRTGEVAVGGAQELLRGVTAAGRLRGLEDEVDEVVRQSGVAGLGL